MDKKKSKGIIIRQLGAKCFRRKTKRNRKCWLPNQGQISGVYVFILIMV